MTARAPLLLLALLIAGPLAAATLTVPAVRDGTGAAVSGRLSVVLVDASGRPVVAANDTGLATAASLAALTEDVALTLAPTTDLAAPGGGPVFYRVRIDAGQARLDQTITLPDGDADLPDLLPPGSVWARDATLAQILLPSAPAGAAAGWGLILSGTPLAPAWSAAAGGGGCTTLACLLDGPAGYGTAGQVATSTGAGWQWSASGGAATWGAITGTISAQTDLTPAAIGAATAAQGALAAQDDPLVLLTAPGAALATGTVSLYSRYAATLTGAVVYCRTAPAALPSVLDVRIAPTPGGTAASALTGTISVSVGARTAAGSIDAAKDDLAAGSRIDIVTSQADACADAAVALTWTRTP